jgi:putative transposase
MLKSIKVRLYPNKDQEDYISNLLGCCRFAYNNCLDYKIKTYNKTKENVSFGQIGKHLVELKNNEETSWLKNAHSKVLQQTLINLEQAYKNFFINNSGFPKFKSKHESKQSCRFPNDAIGKISGNRINIIKPLKNIHFKCSRRDEKHLNKYQKEIRSGTLSRTKSGNYYFSILIDVPTQKELKQTNKVIGLDVGIKDFIVDSNGKKYENIKIKRNNQKKLAKLHRSVSKKVKGSSNRNKARIKLAKFYEKLNNKKDFYLHQVSNKIIDENQAIIIEDLNVSGMMKNHKLARSIQELSLFRFKEMLTYKANWYGRDLIQIDRFFPSSKLCSCCGHKNTELTLKDRSWICSECGTKHDRDFNAAKNILNEGKRILNIGLSSPELTLGEISSLERSMNQEKNMISCFS